MRLSSKVYKIVILGDSSVGKATIRRNNFDYGFKKSYSTSIGADFAVKRMKDEYGNTIIGQIWDLASQSKFAEIRSLHYQGTIAVIFVFDISRRKSFENLSHWLDELMKNNMNRVLPMLLVGNKVDLRAKSENPVTKDEALEYANYLTDLSGLEVPYVEVSLFDNSELEVGIAKLFHNIDIYLEKDYEIKIEINKFINEQGKEFIKQLKDYNYEKIDDEYGEIKIKLPIKLRKKIHYLAKSLEINEDTIIKKLIEDLFQI